MKLGVNDTVDFRRPTTTKEESGWRGPARLVEIGPPAVIKWQDRFMQVRTQDLRRALHYCVFLTMSTTSVAYSMYGNGQLRRPEDPVEVVTAFADNLDGAMVRIGWLLQKDWHRAEGNSKLSELLLAVLHVASCGLYLKGCIGARIGGGISVLEGIAECDTMFLWWWQRGKRGSHSTSKAAVLIASNWLKCSARKSGSTQASYNS